MTRAPVRAMILAAGRGERMRPLTDTMPKPLLSVGGKPLIQYHLEALVARGIKDIVINLAWCGHLIPATLGDGSRFGARIHYSDEGASALDTGGGIFKALPLLGDEPFIVANGDVWSDYFRTQPLPTLQRDDLAHLVLVPNPPHHARGDFGLSTGRVQEDGQERHTFAGIGVYRAELFQRCTSGMFSVVPLLKAAMRENRVAGELYAGQWYDIGTPARLQWLDERLRAQ